MATLHSIVHYLDTLLQPELYTDYSLNGLQVEASVKPDGYDVRRVAVAVDSGRSVIEEAIRADSGLLIVHHGLFWGKPELIRGVLAKKIGLLMRKGCSLYASHLPLDGNPEVGNGFELARFLGLSELRGFLEIDGQTVGAQGTCSPTSTLENFTKKLAQMTGAVEPVVLPFGPDKIETVAVVTGSGAQAISLCARTHSGPSIDLLISGEPKQEAYHSAKELGVNAIFAGHYATETFGVKALQSRLSDTLDVETIFIDEPTGI